MASKTPPPKDKKDKSPQPGIMQRIKIFLGLAPPPKTSVPGLMYRVKNALKCHWRGLLGWIIFFVIVYVKFDKDVNIKKLELLWMGILVLFIIRPVHIPVTACIPIFFLPMTGVVGSRNICSCYMNADIVLFLLSGMIILLLNNCGTDRRLALSIMSYGDPDQHSMKKMVYKCSASAYLLGMLSNRLVSSSMITEYFTNAFMGVEKKFGASPTEPDLTEIRYVVNNAIQTSSAIGSIAIVHSAATTLCFRAIFNECVPSPAHEYPDLFNYLQYTVFALPVSLVIFILNLFYHWYLVQKKADGEMSKACTTMLQKSLAARKAELPKDMTLHEKLCIWALAITMFTHFYRWNYWLGGWTDFRMDSKSTAEKPLPAVKDATVAAIFAVLLHSLPCGFSFVKYTVVSKKKDLPKLKCESAILWWKYVDKNVNYGYFLVLGCGVALMFSSISTGLCDIIGANSGCIISGQSWNLAIMMIIITAAVLSNIVSSTAACVVFLPFVLCTATKGPEPWPQQAYLTALACGIACSFGFCSPFLYSPAYFCHYVGKVPKMAMMKYSIVSILISVVVLWLAIIHYAPIIWDPTGTGHLIIGAPLANPDDSSSPVYKF